MSQNIILLLNFNLLINRCIILVGKKFVIAIDLLNCDSFSLQKKEDSDS